MHRLILILVWNRSQRKFTDSHITYIHAYIIHSKHLPSKNWWTFSKVRKKQKTNEEKREFQVENVFNCSPIWRKRNFYFDKIISNFKPLTRKCLSVCVYVCLCMSIQGVFLHLTSSNNNNNNNEKKEKKRIPYAKIMLI